MTTFLITGSSGFIGHNVVQMLTGYDLFGVDNHTNYDSYDSLALSRLISARQQLLPPSFRELILDIRNVELKSRLHSIGCEPKTVIHTASYPRQHEVQNNPIDASETMISGLLNVLNSTKHSCKKFVFISSSMVYGDYRSGASEETATNPNTLYGILKLAGENIVKNFCSINNINYTIIRPSAVYGELDVSGRLVGKFLTSAIKNEELVVKGQDEILDFTYVKDLARGIVDASLSEVTNNQTYNLTRSDGCHRTILDAANLSIKLANSGTIAIATRDKSFPKRGNLSIDNARRDFAYNPTTDIETGFKKYYDWIRSFYQY